MVLPDLAGRPRRTALAAAAGLAVLILGWVGVAQSGECGAIDRWFGWSGCVRAIWLDDLTGLRHTVVPVPGTGLVAVAGVSVGPGSGPEHRTLYGRIALVDVAAGREVERFRAPVDSPPDRLAVSPDGRHVALTCDARYLCDVAPDRMPEGLKVYDAFVVALGEVPPVGVLQADGPPVGDPATWVRGIPAVSMPAALEGSPTDMAFSADGTALRVDRHGWTVPAGAPLDRSQPALPADGLSLPDGRQASLDRKAGVLRMTGGTAGPLDLPLDLPPGFVPLLRPSLAVSPDGTRLALLLRRFAGPGEPRALLRVWRTGSGQRLLDRAFADDLASSLAFSPAGDGVLVAPAAPFDVAAGTQLRLYGVGR